MSMQQASNVSFDTSMPRKPLNDVLSMCSHLPPSNGKSRAPTPSQPILHRYKDSMTQSTYHGLGRHGTHCKKDSITQEKRSPPAFPWFIPYTFNTLIRELMVGGKKRELLLSVTSI